MRTCPSFNYYLDNGDFALAPTSAKLHFLLSRGDFSTQQHETKFRWLRDDQRTNFEDKFDTRSSALISSGTVHRFDSASDNHLVYRVSAPARHRKIRTQILDTKLQASFGDQRRTRGRHLARRDKLTPVLGTYLGMNPLDGNAEGTYKTKDTATQCYRLGAGTDIRPVGMDLMGVKFNQEVWSMQSSNGGSKPRRQLMTRQGSSLKSEKPQTAEVPPIQATIDFDVRAWTSRDQSRRTKA